MAGLLEIKLGLLIKNDIQTDSKNRNKKKSDFVNLYSFRILKTYRNEILEQRRTGIEIAQLMEKALVKESTTR